MKKLLLKGIFILSIILISNNQALAFDFQINKAKVKINLPPGWSDGDTIGVKNIEEEPIEIRVYVGDWVYNNQDGSKNFMPAGTDSKSAAEWIKFYPADFTLPGKGRQEIKYVVGVPPDAVGGYYAVLFFEVGGGGMWDESKGVMVKVYNRLASLFYVEVDGTIKREGRVSDFMVNASSGDIEVEAVFENIGNVNITARGTFDIIDQDGLVLTRSEFNTVYTMPQDKAKLYAKSEGAVLSQGKFDVILTFDLEEGILVKEYQVDVSSSGQIVNLKEIVY